MYGMILLLIRIFTFEGRMGGIRMPLEKEHTDCPGCGQPIEIRASDPQFFEARFRKAGGDALKIPGRCGVCGGPLARKKRGRIRESDPVSEVPADEAAGSGGRRSRSDTGKLLSLGLPFWGLIAGGVFAFLLMAFCGGISLLWGLSQRPASALPPNPLARPEGLPAGPPPPAPALPPPARPAAVPPPATQFPGLLGYWSLDEGQGDRATDSSGNGLHAKIVNGRWVEGVRGKALYLSGPGSYLDYGDSPRLSFAARGSFTLAFWAQTRRADGTLLSQRQSTDGSPVVDIFIEGGRVTAQVRQDRSEIQGPVAINGGRIGDGAWHHVVLMRDGDAVELFLDGVSQGKKSGPASGGAITTNLRAVGSERYWTTRGANFGNPSFEGSVDEFCAFGRALKADEVRSLAGR
jgi:hypothetical protein